MEKPRIVRNNRTIEKARELPYYKEYGGDVEWWHVSRLFPHRSQTKLFPPMTDHQIETLRAEIRAKGLELPLKILSSGAIFGGSQRFRANPPERKFAPVRIERRLDNASTREIELEMIKDNLNRRHLPHLQLVTVLKARYELELEPPLRPKPAQLKRYISRELNVDVKTAGRYLSLITLPIEIQQTIDNVNGLSVLALELLKLSPLAVDEVASQIRAGADPKLAIREALSNLPSSNRANSHVRLPKRIEIWNRKGVALLREILQHQNFIQRHWSSHFSELQQQLDKVIQVIDSRRSQDGT